MRPHVVAVVLRLGQGSETLLLWCHGNISAGPAGAKWESPGDLLFLWGFLVPVWELGLAPALHLLSSPPPSYCQVRP